MNCIETLIEELRAMTLLLVFLELLKLKQFKGLFR